LLSGWFVLMQKFPDRSEKEYLFLNNLSGSMGIGVSMNRILDIAVCPSGLRFGMIRIFGPFCRKIFIPWEHLSIERKNGLLEKTAKLQFGNPRIGSLSIPSHIADRLARSAQGNWPEEGSFPYESKSEILASLFRIWLFSTLAASLFFIFGPKFIDTKTVHIPIEMIAVMIFFPAICFGVAVVFEYFSRIKQDK
jgi:hypothetical protein